MCVCACAHSCVVRTILMCQVFCIRCLNPLSHLSDLSYSLVLKPWLCSQPLRPAFSTTLLTLCPWSSLTVAHVPSCRGPLDPGMVSAICAQRRGCTGSRPCCMTSVPCAGHIYVHNDASLPKRGRNLFLFQKGMCTGWGALVSPQREPCGFGGNTTGLTCFGDTAPLA